MPSSVSLDAAWPDWVEPLRRILIQTEFLQVDLWRWLVLALLLALAFTLAWAGPSLVAALARRLFPDSEQQLGVRLVRAAVGPVRLLAGVLVFSAGLPALGLPAAVAGPLAVLEKVLVVLGFAWLALRAIDVVVGAAAESFARQGKSVGVSIASLARRVAKVVVAAAALLAFLRLWGIDVTGIVAGLGIGGLAVALAAQKSLENLFGGVTLIVDQPVRVGDFCRFGERVGTVEEVGLRSTRVRTLERTVVTIPNAEFSSMQLENFARRDRMWFKHALGLRYETSPEQMRRVLKEIKQLLVSHPQVDPDPARVRFVRFGAYSLDLEIFAYVRTRDINEYLAIQEELLLSLMDVVARCGTGFAFPSQTIYTASDSGIDAARENGAAPTPVERSAEP